VEEYQDATRGWTITTEQSVAGLQGLPQRPMTNFFPFSDFLKTPKP
jgi:hypothetical protein